LGLVIVARKSLFGGLMTQNNLVIWDSGKSGEIATRVAIAGDFLPAGNLSFRPNAGWRDMALDLADYFDDVSTTFINLECPVGDRVLRPRPLNGIGQIVFAPDDSLKYLHAINVKALGIANNHTYDFSYAGLQQTRAAICGCEITPLGAGHTTREAPEVFVFDGPRNLRVGFWASAKATHDAASRELAGVEPTTHARAIEALDEMKSRGATFCIALIHAGCLRTNHPDPEDVRLMNLLGQAGFNVVAASHSHRISGYAHMDGLRKHEAFCFYGLGSLVSGYVSSSLEREGLVVTAGFNGDGKFARLEIRPVILAENGFGMIPDTAGAGKILDRFRELSNDIADRSYEKKFYQDVSRGLLRLYLRDARAAFRSRGIRGLASKVGRVRLRHVRRLVHKVTG
jgi:poly-gamma-glutamate capsule biosynthesis protein CapA/YwtB (metallophosphatase superfamily)